jgi:hypothetical protein
VRSGPAGRCGILVTPDTYSIPFVFGDFAIALFIGALVGIEREKNRDPAGLGTGGLRTLPWARAAGRRRSGSFAAVQPREADALTAARPNRRSGILVPPVSDI